jgi:hypothetical protein
MFRILRLGNIHSNFPKNGANMKKILMLIVVLICSACSRQHTFEDPHASGFYFTNSKGTLYEYSGSNIKKINTDGTKFVGRSNNIVVSNTNEKAINIINKRGHIIFRHEPEKSIVSATLNKSGTVIYYATKDGGMYKYNRSTNSTFKYNVSVYPIPKQMILDEKQARIIYHTNTNVSAFNLYTDTVETLMVMPMAIKSIAYHEQSKTVYVSSPIHGKIYKVNTKTKQRMLLHNPLSVAGSSICFNSEGTILYYSKSNGRDTTISGIDMDTGSIEVAYVLSNTMFINNFIVKD